MANAKRPAGARIASLREGVPGWLALLRLSNFCFLAQDRAVVLGFGHDLVDEPLDTWRGQLVLASGVE